jgi:hypothetical protein
LPLLNRIKSFFGAGNIRINKINSSAIYSVESFKDLTNVIIPHFLKYPLITGMPEEQKTSRLRPFLFFVLFSSLIGGDRDKRGNEWKKRS